MRRSRGAALVLGLALALPGLHAVVPHAALHTALAQPPAPVRVDAGGAGYTSADGTGWAADRGADGGLTYTTPAAIAGTAEGPLYQSVRYGTFTYDLPVPNGPYTVALRFAEVYYTEPGQRVFHVDLEGERVLGDFDLVQEAGPYTAVDRVFPVTVADGRLTLAFLPVRDAALVAAIEVVPAPPAAATATATPPATSTPLPAATATALATQIPPTATPQPAGTQIEGVPVCAGHEPTRWHPLVERNADESIRCTYGHEHHGDPNTLNDLFGPPGAWFGQSGQAISYPWFTFPFAQGATALPLPAPHPDPATWEPNAKHPGYKWYVKRDLPCYQPISTEGEVGCFRAYRIQVHQMGTVHDSTTRFHSFSVEAVVERNGGQGIARGGGWMDTGFLGLLVDGGDRLVCPALPSNPPGFYCPFTGTSGTHRDASSVNVPAPHTPHGMPSGAERAWYATHTGGVSATVAVEEFGPTDYAAPFQQLFFDPAYQRNNSHGHVSAGTGTGTGAWPADAEGRVTHQEYQTRHGHTVQGCTAPGLDCVPFLLERVPVGNYTLLNNDPPFLHPDFDVPSPVTGGSLIQYPN